MIRLLLDQGLPRSAAKVLSAAGWDVAHVGEIGLSRAEDLRVLEHARNERRVCVTLDADTERSVRVRALPITTKK